MMRNGIKFRDIEDKSLWRRWSSGSLKFLIMLDASEDK